MKKFLFITVLMLAAAVCFAHPPKDVTVSFDPATNMLSITATHLIKESKVTDPAKHFVKDIAVTINGNPAVVGAYTYQQFDNGEKIILMLNVKSKDKISVKARCNLAGEKTTEIAVP